MILGMITGVIIFTFGILIGAALYKIELVRTVDETKSTLTEVKGSMKTLTDEQGEIKEQIATITTDVSEVKQTAQGLTSKVSSIETTMNNLDGEVTTLKSRVSTVEQTVDSITILMIAKLQAELAELEA